MKYLIIEVCTGGRSLFILALSNSLKRFMFFEPLFIFLLLLCFQNILRGCSVLLGPGTSGLWRALIQSQNHIPGGGPGGLTELLEQYAQNLAQNMKLTYLNPVALVAPNLGESKANTHSDALSYTRDKRKHAIIKSEIFACRFAVVSSQYH